MRISQSASAVRILTIRLKAKNMAQALRSTVLKASFDGEETIWTPVGDFFNIGVGLKQYRMWERAVDACGTALGYLDEEERLSCAARAPDARCRVEGSWPGAD